MSREIAKDYAEGWERRKEERQRQIEEMANDILWESPSCLEMSLYDCKGIAIGLIDKDYRKASTVAREIFEEIYNIRASGNGFAEYYENWFAKLTELKNKYTEGKG